MFTLVVPLQGELPLLLDAEREDTAWVVTITLLVSAVATPISGRLGDMYGKRRAILALMGVMIVGSLVAALTGSLLGVIIGRGLQGAAIGVIPLGIAVMRDVLPPERLGSAVALMSATMGVGGAIGMPLAAYVAQNADWLVLFWMSAGLGLLGLVIIAAVVPSDTLRAGGRLDVPGALGLAAGLTGIMLFISRGADWGWSSPLALASAAGGGVILLLWGFHQLRVRGPLVDLRVASRPPVLLTNLAAIGMGFALFGSNVSFPQMLVMPESTGAGFGLTMIQAALCIMPSGIIMMLLSPLSGLLERTFGPRLLFTVGASSVVLAYVFVLLWSSEVWHLVTANALIGVGIAFSFAAMPMIIMRAVPAGKTGVSNGLNALFRSIGSASAAAVMGGVLAAMSRLDADGVPHPTAAAFTVCFWIAISAALAATALSIAIPRGPSPEQRSAVR